jgi:hypothetical protein
MLPTLPLPLLLWCTLPLLLQLLPISAADKRHQRPNDADPVQVTQALTPLRAFQEV